jgi:3-isopropylmalate/(R)-2-methylmalate dehydratase large subunit
MGEKTLGTKGTNNRKDSRGTARTLFDKIWDRHVIVQRGENEALLRVDRHLVTDGSFHAFASLNINGRKVRKPERTFAIADHYVPTRGREAGVAGVKDHEVRNILELFERNTRVHGIRNVFGIDDPRQGIVHVVGPELGISQPGLFLVCGDSHTSTHGAFGAYAVGIGASQNAQVLATQCLWQTKPRTLRISVDGVAPKGVTAKDIALAIIARVGIAGGAGHAIEYSGSAIRALSMEGRLTVCNMSIEAGARAGMIAPDDTTYAYLEGREFAPKGPQWERALALWRTLPTDEDARFDREVTLSAETLCPMVSWGTTPEETLPITGTVPDPATVAELERRRRFQRALEYMRLTPGAPLDGIGIDRVFIGSCTNGRIEDLRAAAEVVRGRRALVPAMISPGSTSVKRQAEAEGLAAVFRGAGFEWRDSGCSMCGGNNEDVVPRGERCASTTNRNFEGRQGPGALTHIMSPAMAAAAAISGRLTDVRKLLVGR